MHHIIYFISYCPVFIWALLSQLQRNLNEEYPYKLFLVKISMYLNHVLLLVLCQSDTVRCKPITANQLLQANNYGAHFELQAARGVPIILFQKEILENLSCSGWRSLSFSVYLFGYFRFATKQCQNQQFSNLYSSSVYLNKTTEISLLCRNQTLRSDYVKWNWDQLYREKRLEKKTYRQSKSTWIW